MSNIKNTLIPAQLFVGPQDFILEKVEHFLQQTFCKQTFCKQTLCKQNSAENIIDCFCNECKKIKNQQHEFIVFINPEKDYTVKDIDIIFQKINFALDDSQKFFFVLQKAHTLNLACANKLLKVLEEPSSGYNFILLTNNVNSILPTIVSRCYIVDYSSKIDEFTQHSLLSFFYNKNLDSPAEFDKELRVLGLNDSESIKLMHQMVASFAKKLVDLEKQEQLDSTQAKEKQYVQEVYDYLKDASRKMPRSGSSNIFWKNIYIDFPRNDF